MDYVVLVLLVVCCFRGWFKGLLLTMLFLVAGTLVLLLVLKNTDVGQMVVDFLKETKVSGLFYENVLEKITGLIK